MMLLSTDRRFPWLLVMFSALALELGALYFQYVLELDPCVLCIYQRVAVAGIVLGGLIGALAPQFLVVRLLGTLTFGLSAGIGLKLALDHIAVQAGETMGCDFMANFPAWLKLDEWLPAVFLPTGSCDEIDWLFLGWGMPRWMVVIFSLYLAALVFALVMEISARSRKAEA